MKKKGLSDDELKAKAFDYDFFSLYDCYFENFYFIEDARDDDYAEFGNCSLTEEKDIRWFQRRNGYWFPCRRPKDFFN